MRNKERDCVNRLSELLKGMYRIITSNFNSDLDYARKTIVILINGLENGLSDNATEYKELISEAGELYKTMFPPRGGLSDFNIWDNDYEVRYKANQEYEQIKTQIDMILYENNQFY